MYKQNLGIQYKNQSKLTAANMVVSIEIIFLKKIDEGVARLNIKADRSQYGHVSRIK